MIHTYKPTDVVACADSREFVFIGDSVTRTLFFQFAHIIGPNLPLAPPDDNQKHADYSLRADSGITVSFYWDPFLNSTRVNDLINTDIYASRTVRRPAMLVLGSGLWHLRYAETSGGIPSWEANMERPNKPADEVVVLPVEQVITSKLSHDRAETIRPSFVDAMNSDLFHRINPSLANYFNILGRTPPAIPVSLPVVFNDMVDIRETGDGLHFSPTIVRQQANLLLNLRCNDHLPQHFPYDTTCCRSYPWPGIMHFVVLVFTISWGPISLLSSQHAGQRFRHIPTINAEHIPRLVISGAILVIYMADRTNLWLKEHKSFNPWTFGLLNVLALILGFATVKRSDKDLGFLNRDQTDEWKGWMQIAILIYHYLGASKISGIYNPIRVLVAAYLFMTGYGHGTYYLKKADFGFLRVAQIMVRLNLFTLILAYTMDTDYISYYFAPLVSMWFLIIYATMAIAPQYNERTPFLLGKLFLSAAAVTWFMKTEWLLQSVFDVLRYVFRIEWSAREWAFRVNLDLWIVYAGILAAVAVIKTREHRITEHPHFCWRVFVAMLWYFAFELTQESKFTYNVWHPYLAVVPVLAFAVLRNASVILRSASSRAFAFTFVIQYHFWLAGDTKGILLVLPGTRWRPINFVFTTFLFIFVSHWVAKATGELTVWICSDSHKAAMPLPVTQTSSDTQSRQESIPLVAVNGAKLEGGSGSPDAQAQQPRRWLDRLAEGQHRRMRRRCRRRGNLG
ncbi:10 TM acyl transferase domain found in Cas1p-domain-containing protein [Mucidula mucida]|nr:10 TM acyl transferase domain found in Cas1p-domain-containing protein [Mucidula mucida]